MDDLNDNPQQVAEDIISQATKPFPFPKEATERITYILTAYHQLREEIAEPKQQKQTTKNIIYDGGFAWEMIDNQKQGPYCARCHSKSEGKDLIRLIDHKDGRWDCPKCSHYFFDASHKKQQQAINDSNHYTWMSG